MSTNVSIRGLSRAGFRVQTIALTGTTKQKVTSSTVKSVDIDDHRVQWTLQGEKSNFIRVANAGTFTVTIASPGVFSKSSHGFVAGDVLVFSTTGALPTGLTAGTKYYVIATGLTTSVFRVSTTYGGSVVNTTGSQSGTHTVTPASANIIGLERRGFRIKNTAGTIVTVKLGSGVHQIDLADYKTCRVLRRNFGRYLSSTSATSVAIRGIQNQQNGFDVNEGSGGASVLTSTNTDVTAADTVVVGSKTYTYVTALTEAKATNTVNDTGGTPANGNTVVVNGRTYTFKTILSSGPAVNDEVLINGGAGSMTNLSRAINKSGGSPGVDYTIATANAHVSASAVTGTTITLTALVVGTAPNSYTLSKVGANLGVGAGVFSGGVAAVANEVLVSGTADGSLTNLSEAINAGANVGVDYSTGTTANADATASAVGVPAAHKLTISPVQGSNQSVAVSETATTLSFSLAALTDALVRIYRLTQATVDPQLPNTYTQLRRHFKSFIEA